MQLLSGAAHTAPVFYSYFHCNIAMNHVRSAAEDRLIPDLILYSDRNTTTYMAGTFIPQGQFMNTRTLFNHSTHLHHLARLARLVMRALGTATLIACLPGFAVETGQAAPAFSLPATGSEINLADYKGKVVYLDFWASWCGPCKQSFPWMNAMQTKYGPQGLKVIAVNLDANKADWKQFLDIVPANFVVAFDQKGMVARQYNIKGMPTSLLIGRDGKIIVQHAGFNAADRATLEQAIETLIGKK
jgi:cytochrome c biogenesis protein CcmG/thiol:disulfide interchange protein DsbE